MLMKEVSLLGELREEDWSDGVVCFGGDGIKTAARRSGSVRQCRIRHMMMHEADVYEKVSFGLLCTVTTSIYGVNVWTVRDLA